MVIKLFTTTYHAIVAYRMYKTPAQLTEKTEKKILTPPPKISQLSTSTQKNTQKRDY